MLSKLLEKMYIKDKPEIYVVGVDKAATGDFITAIRIKANQLGYSNLEIKLIKKYGKIPPRVIGTKPNPKFLDIATKTAEAIEDAIKKDKRHKHIPKVTISCNTIGIRKYQRYTDKLLAQKGYKINQDFILVTPINAVVRDAMQRKRQGRPLPLLLGTVPTSKDLKVVVPTLFSTAVKQRLNLIKRGTANKFAKLMQEITWRDKGVNGSDTNTAPSHISDITNPIILEERVAEALELIEKCNFKNVYLACTEYFDAFFKHTPESHEDKLIKINFIDPAELIAKQLLT